MRQYIVTALAVIATLGISVNCIGNRNKVAAEDTTATGNIIQPSEFDSDSAFAFIRRQVEFGPRVSGTPGNKLCRQYIVSELERHGADTVTVQEAEVTVFTGEKLPIANIMGSYQPDMKDRILLLAHYDTRPWADSDNYEENRHLPVLGANDGASGVAVLLEVARLLNEKHAPVGVDLLFVDAEDYGQISGFSTHDDSWCLGTQYWAEHIPYAPDSLPRYAILLDMVGGLGAQFHREYFSDEEAPGIVDKVWAMARNSGFSDRFINQKGGAVVDDHIFINKAGIPAIDIIESKNASTGTFPPTWHTVNDNLENIDRSSLKAVGQTVINLIHNEKNS